MAGSASEAEFEKRVEQLSGDLVEVVRTHIVRGVPVDAVLVGSPGTELEFAL